MAISAARRLRHPARHGGLGRGQRGRRVARRRPGRGRGRDRGRGEAIAATDGVDVVFVGLTDLSVDLGVPGDYGHADVQAAVDRTIAAARRAGAAGFQVGSAAAALERRRGGPPPQGRRPVPLGRGAP
ncbi:MAG: aldolase/citrate lyase family protein [Thermoleophilia bacterium]